MAQLPSQSQFGDYGEWPGRDVLDSGGERLGGVREIYLDRETGRPEWVLVDVDGAEARFVPLADASVESSTIRVAHSAAAIRNAPGIGAEPRIDQSEERRLYDHYGLGYSETDSGSGLPTDEPTREHEHPAAGPTPTAWGAPDETPTEEPARAWGAEDATPVASTPPWRAETLEEPPSSWSEVASEAPPPAEPPSPEELEAADIPEPPAISDRSSEPAPFLAVTEEPSTPSPAGPDLDPPAEAADLTAQPGPDNVGVVTPPSPPAAAEPEPVAAPEPLRPPAPEPPRESTLEAVKSRKRGIFAGVAIALVLLFIIRKLR